MMRRFGIEGFHNWDAAAAVYLAEPGLFINHEHYLQPELSGLSKGLLAVTGGGHSGIRVNLPEIADIGAFTQDVYAAWLNVTM
jgi:inosine-uridine nucleoside N-ribohydrolase